MFRLLNKQGVESDEGFAVQFTGRFSLDYIENGHKTELAIESDSFGGSPSVHVARDAFARTRFGRPFHAADASQEAQERKLDNLRRALEHMGIKLVVER